MRAVSAQRSRFCRRPYYGISEIERNCNNALIAVGLMPSSPEPIRIERFIEKYFKLSPSYEPLPPGILGFTEFRKDGVSAIVVSAALDNEATSVAERRIRTTLAHEGGHGLLHAYLFAHGEKPPRLFDEENNQPEIMCRDVDGVPPDKHRYDGKWWEFQANRAIGSLYNATSPYASGSRAVLRSGRCTRNARH